MPVEVVVPARPIARAAAVEPLLVTVAPEVTFATKLRLAPLASVSGLLRVIVVPLIPVTTAVPLLGEPLTAVRPRTVWPRAMPEAEVTLIVVLLVADAVVVVCAATTGEVEPAPVSAPIVTVGRLVALA